MKKYLVIAICFLSACVWMQRRALVRERAEKTRYKGNTEVLLDTMQRYVARDSLNVARLQSLELKLKEYKKYRANDLALIEDLRMKGRNLSSVSNLSTNTTDTLFAYAHDTIYIKDSIKVEARCVDISKPYIELHGCMVGDEFKGTLHTYDSLLVVESIYYKRFLGFLWKTKRIKNKYIDVFSRNPRTTIADAEIISFSQ